MIDGDLLKEVETFNLLLGQVSEDVQEALLNSCKKLLMIQGLISMSDGIRLNLSQQTAETILSGIEKTLKDEIID